MTVVNKTAALAAGFVAALGIVAAGPRLEAQDASSDTRVLVVDDLARLEFIEKSNVASLRPGIIKEMELQIGMPVVKGGRIGSLHSESADLAVRKAELIARSEGPKQKAQAQQFLALAVVAINRRLDGKIKGSVSYEERQKAEAELKVATAMVLEAEEKIEQDKAELAIARQALAEHTIVAPFNGVVVERLKNPGESVQANDAVVKLGNLDRLRAYAYISTELSFRVKEGQVVELQPRLDTPHTGLLPIEQRKFRGKISFIDPEIQGVGETAVRVYAEFDNRNHELRPGLKGQLTIYLGSEAPAVGARGPAGPAAGR